MAEKGKGMGGRIQGGRGLARGAGARQEGMFFFEKRTKKLLLLCVIGSLADWWGRTLEDAIA
jgi:hypothetical protein